MSSREGTVVETKVIIWNSATAEAVAVFGAREAGYYWRVKACRFNNVGVNTTFTIDSYTGAVVSHSNSETDLAATSAGAGIDFTGFFTKTGDDLRITATAGASGRIIIEKIKGEAPSYTYVT